MQKGTALSDHEDVFIRKDGTFFPVVYSSSPPVSGHLAAAVLSDLLDLPWVADFRDPWIGNASTPMDTFREHMAYLKQEGYRVVPLAALQRMHASGEPM
mgnify:CR=1 FL=1